MAYFVYFFTFSHWHLRLLDSPEFPNSQSNALLRLDTCTDSSRICKIELNSTKHDTRKKKRRKKKKGVHRIAFVCALASTESGQPFTEDRHDWRAKTLDIGSQDCCKSQASDNRPSLHATMKYSCSGPLDLELETWNFVYMRYSCNIVSSYVMFWPMVKPPPFRGGLICSASAMRTPVSPHGPL